MSEPSHQMEVDAPLYDELRRVADRHFARQPRGHTLQPTALVNEAYLKLAEEVRARAMSRTHFMSLASRVMRQILVDHARARSAGKRGGGDLNRITLSGVTVDDPSRPIDLLVLEEALEELTRLSQRKARLIELRFFGGLSEAEAAEVLGVSRASATRQWRMIRAWLSHRMTGSAE